MEEPKKSTQSFVTEFYREKELAEEFGISTRTLQR
jgi:hypothetical protein